ncbi:hypothetical protein CK203_057029 [Vitis vinifera]|uniref:Uncharacterized protein n=1 Tax=Vitis vinifera TaxID=29760 RepID=A0A438GNB1_VITVI|nr:hypothetical protein CK203_057029 [Vitis vinifera]
MSAHFFRGFRGLLIKTDLCSRAWIRIRGRLVRGLDPHRCYIGIETKDRWASGLAIANFGEHPALLYCTPTSPPPSGPTVQ